jgi:hypothetical protein
MALNGDIGTLESPESAKKKAMSSNLLNMKVYFYSGVGAHGEVHAKRSRC